MLSYLRFLRMCGDLIFFEDDQVVVQLLCGIKPRVKKIISVTVIVAMRCCSTIEPTIRNSHTKISKIRK